LDAVDVEEAGGAAGDAGDVDGLGVDAVPAVPAVEGGTSADELVVGSSVADVVVSRFV